MLATEVSASAYRFVFSNLKPFLLNGWPVIALLTANQVNYEIRGDQAAVSSAMVQLVVEAAFALMWHRFYLIKGQPSFWWRGLPAGSSKEERKALAKLVIRFLLWSVGMWLLILIAFLLLTFLGSTLAGPGFDADAHPYLIPASAALLLSFPIFCVLPFFPAVAVGREDASISRAITLTKGHTLEIWLAYVFSLVPVWVLLLGLDAVLIDPEWLTIPSYPELVVSNAVMVTVSLLLLVLGVSTNSEIFRRLSGYSGEPPANSPEALETR